jgi:ABC-2 type transport system ATP-binding protein
MIKVHNLTHHYGIRPILRGINMEIATGELVVLLGPNGMGKTTLLGCMAGVLWPARGYVAFDGVERRATVEEEKDLRRRIAYLPDTTWMPSARTGREFILSVGQLYGHDELELFDHADRLLAVFDLTEQADATIGSYSAGQRKKIALASVLITKAPYLLLDEPFSGGLDPAGILALSTILNRLKGAGGTTIVMTTPVPELVDQLADRVAIIRRGELSAYDTPEGLRHLAASEGTFAEALQTLVFPETYENIRRYFGDHEKGGRT